MGFYILTYGMTLYNLYCMIKEDKYDALKGNYLKHESETDYRVSTENGPSSLVNNIENIHNKLFQR